MDQVGRLALSIAGMLNCGLTVILASLQYLRDVEIGKGVRICSFEPAASKEDA